MIKLQSMIQEYEDGFIRVSFGTCDLTPTGPFVAGTFTSLTFTLSIGRYGVDDGGHIKLAWPVTNSFGIPQFERPKDQNYTVISTTGTAKLEYKFSHNNYIRPFMPCITIKVYDGSLAAGDVVTIEMGRQSEGGEGLKVQTYAEKNVEFRFVLDPFGTNKYTILPDSPTIDIVAGSTRSLTVINPSEVKVGEEFWLVVRTNDFLGNTSIDYHEPIEIEIGKLELKATIGVDGRGWQRIEGLKLEDTGIYYPKIKSGVMETIGSPLVVTKQEPELQLFWGDLHGQTGETVGSGTIDEYLTFGRDDAGLDFISHAANAFQVTKEIWKNTQRAIKEYHIPHRYITFLGYEWSGVTSAGGDHNVYYLSDDMPIHRCSHALIDDLSDLETDRYPVSELYQEFEGRNDVIIIPHIGGRRATLDVIDEELTPFIEIVSVHGHFEWFAREALNRELKTGFIASSDTHSGRPGDTFPVSFIEAVKAGLTGVYAKELTREALWDAFKKRHVYATTSPRIILKFSLDDAIMGDMINLPQGEFPQFDVEVTGTAPIEQVEIHKGTDCIYSHHQTGEYHEDELIIRWTGARTEYRRRNLDWSGSITIEDGTFTVIKPVGFDLNWEGIKHDDESLIKFESTTAGDYDGIHIRFDGSDKTKIHISTPLTKISFKPGEIDAITKYELGLVEAALEIVPVPKDPYPRHIQFSFTDSDFNGTSAAYYVKILQDDGEKAWTSPIFVNWEQDN